MLALRRILFPTDFSECSGQALRHAVKLAREQRAELHLLHAIVLQEHDSFEPTHQLPDPSLVRRALDELAEKRMTELAREHEVPDLVLTQVHRRDVSPAPPIVEYARTANIDLIIMGTHGRRGFRRLLLGSVASEVIRLAPCPVMAIKAGSSEEGLHPFHRILAPVDFSDSSRAALGLACALARHYRAQLGLLHVLDDLFHPTFYNMGAMRLSDLQPDILPRTERALKDLFAESPDCEGIPVTIDVEEGHPQQGIVRTSRDRGSDLIVMSTHGMRGLRDFLLGSTTERVLASADCPLLVVKSSNGISES